MIMTIPFKIGEAEKARKLEDFVKDQNTISLEGLRALVVDDNELNREDVYKRQSDIRHNQFSGWGF